ncbi:MAG: lytic murein transglycosylase [Nitrospirae bacterium]|nr:lytic murein transglycosylase [Nitrospirota bacterium]
MQIRYTAKHVVIFLIALIQILAASSCASASVSRKGESFDDWLKAFRADAMRDGISSQTLDAAFEGVEPISRVITLDRSQAEFKLTFPEYRDRIMPESRIRAATEKLAENRAMFDEIGARFGVQPNFLAALWAVESNLGSNKGNFPAVASLATLAYDGRRSGFFRKELMEVMRLIDRGYVRPESMRSSWAGAMGQMQFMPSTIKSYWFDYDNNGMLDIWDNPAEAIASAANYLSKLGWNRDETWGRIVTVPDGFDAHGKKGAKKTSAEWSRLGLRLENGSELPEGDPASTLVVVDKGGPTCVVFENHRHVMSWNKSTFFAVAVGMFADRLAVAPAQPKDAP